MSNRPYEERRKDYLAVMRAAQNAGIPHPEIIAAQWALESDWGRKVTGKNNYWGIKAGNGDPNNNEAGTVAWTKENIKGKNVSVQQKFRDYESLDDALLDRASFTSKKGGRYDKAGYFTATSPYEAAMALQRAGYATDPNYGQTLVDVIKGMKLDPYNGQQYDFSTTPTEISPNYKPVLNPNLFNFPQAIPKTMQSLEQFNALNGQMGQIGDIEGETVTENPYQNQLAQAFGIKPRAKQGLPDYIGDLVRSIYDQA